MKKIILFIVIAVLLYCPTLVFAAQCNNNSIKVDGQASFTYCVRAICKMKNGNPVVNTVYNNSSIGVICNNGNQNPYYDNNSFSSTCRLKDGETCNLGEEEPCTVTVKYDCNRTSSGSKYTKPTTIKKRTTRRNTSRTTLPKTTITTSVTTTVAKSNTNLKSIVLSNGNINFNPEVYQYTINVEENVDTINVTAIPEDSTSKVTVNGNTEIKNGSIITIIVNGKDNSSTLYKISVNKEEKKLSDNAYLSELSIDNYSISFDSKINEYFLTIDNGVKELNINYTTEDENSKVSIEGNENLEKGSKIIIKVTAEDGTENTYNLNISIKKQSNFIKILFIIILILALLAGAYYVYIKFVKNKKSGDKYEYE